MKLSVKPHNSPKFVALRPFIQSCKLAFTFASINTALRDHKLKRQKKRASERKRERERAELKYWIEISHVFCVLYYNVMENCSYKYIFCTIFCASKFHYAGAASERDHVSARNFYFVIKRKLIKNDLCPFIAFGIISALLACAWNCVTFTSGALCRT